ncbi:MAG: DUF2911 domain-containing protein [Flavobacteriales bacterium]|tara:strand:+ start:1655 stop:2230 length:576 start_codon:yes stop_codon:yes gene_type:complete
MKKLVKILLWIAGVIGVLLLLFNFILWPILQQQTKKSSPEKNITYSKGELRLNLFYCSPSKKDREIFGNLVPYDEVWRTGANEASTFTTNKDIMIAGKPLPAGKYTLWTIPTETSWKVIFNDKMYGWGVKLTNQKASRDPDHDVLVVDGKVSKSLNTVEKFSITLRVSSPDTSILMFAWDNVVVPLEIRHQ